MDAAVGDVEVVIGVYAGSYYPLVAGRAAVSTPPPLHRPLRGVLKSLREFIQKFDLRSGKKLAWAQQGILLLHDEGLYINL